MTEQTNIISLADRRKSQEVTQCEDLQELTVEEAQRKYVEMRKNVLDLLTLTQVVVNQTPTILEAVIFLKDPSTGVFTPGATSQKVMDQLVETMGGTVYISAMPEGEDEQ
jgi:hypothetical protein